MVMGQANAVGLTSVEGSFFLVQQINDNISYTVQDRGKTRTTNRNSYMAS